MLHSMMHCSRAERATESLPGSGSAYGHGWMLHCPLSIPTYSSLNGGMDRCPEVSSDGSLVGGGVAATTTNGSGITGRRGRKRCWRGMRVSLQPEEQVDYWVPKQLRNGEAIRPTPCAPGWQPSSGKFSRSIGQF